ncbi:hypothetical protein PM10SUCC1_00220 [Propionigenium maris DSM 9537]|uniref:Uncharacterized protein n=1 Tax=Propionigenium maris DSM 9537 TaxID=1123000 RepID=A0A9W6GIX4_9FUSO|nr:hypothetical protein [Propionigenium maris]GLI54507.1 hypothetical protein PM10SUCC1_00220 [Propionigenium maris DSM 9537]
MLVKLYLERINQEMINKHKANEIIEMIDKAIIEKKDYDPDWGGNLWEKECCILNFDKKNPNICDLQKIGEFITMRREKFGALVWVRKTNKVYQIDDQAFMVLNNLDHGVSINQAAKSADVPVEDIKSLIVELIK